MKLLSFFCAFGLAGLLSAQATAQGDTLTLLFVGDIMGHEPQIQAAYRPATGTYAYDSVFLPLAPLLHSADFTIANLEVTLAGKPYAGYPQFSSPDALAEACKNQGIDVLVTANNHSCDRGKKGILRTLTVLDSLGMRHTGTFKDAVHRDSSNLLVMQKKGFRLGLLNYTYGTNGLPIPHPTQVNMLDTLLMAADIQKAQLDSLDKLIVFVHWGEEYAPQPSLKQLKMADFLFRQGVDVVVGSHPHVLQKMMYFPANGAQKERLIAYSLGNFVSNQRTRKRDGGAIFSVSWIKSNQGIRLNTTGYYLTWVLKTTEGSQTRFSVLPAATADSSSVPLASKASLGLFLSDSRLLLGKENQEVPELFWPKMPE